MARNQTSQIILADSLAATSPPVVVAEELVHVETAHAEAGRDALETCAVVPKCGQLPDLLTGEEGSLKAAQVHDFPATARGEGNGEAAGAVGQEPHRAVAERPQAPARMGAPEVVRVAVVLQALGRGKNTRQRSRAQGRPGQLRAA